MTVYKPNNACCLGSKETIGRSANSQLSVWVIDQLLSPKATLPAELEWQPAILSAWGESHN